MTVSGSVSTLFLPKQGQDNESAQAYAHEVCEEPPYQDADFHLVLPAGAGDKLHYRVSAEFSYAAAAGSGAEIHYEIQNELRQKHSRYDLYAIQPGQDQGGYQAEQSDGNQGQESGCHKCALLRFGVDGHTLAVLVKSAHHPLNK